MVKAAGGYGAVLAELVGLRGASATGRIAKEGAETFIDGVKQTRPDRVYNRLAEEASLPEPELPNPDEIRFTGFTPSEYAARTDNAFQQADSILENRIASAFDKGVKPNLGTQTTPQGVERYRESVLQTVKSINQNKDNLTFQDPLTGETITGQTPKNLSQLRDGLEQTKKSIFERYNELATQAGESGLRIGVAPVANRLDEIINDEALRISNPEAVKYAQEVQERLLQSGEVDAVTAQQIIQNYNQSLQAFYRNPTPEALTRNAVDAYMVNNMRQR